MNAQFVNYAFQDLPRKKIKKRAAQYDGVDMTVFLGANEDNFPFLIQTCDDDCHVMIWNSFNGIMEHTDEDPVRDYAIVQYLRNHAYPVFASQDAALKWAHEHKWPRKQRETNGA